MSTKITSVGPSDSVGSMSTATTSVVHVPKHLTARLLYPNPVCLLTTVNEEERTRNVMTISWLTPIDNHGHFVCSINSKRHSLKMLDKNAEFVLNVPVQGMEETVLNIGTCSGATTEDKFSKFGIKTCLPGWEPLNDKEFPCCIAVDACVAHIQCHVEERLVRENSGHQILFCQIQSAWVLPTYWNGKNFAPQRTTTRQPEESELPPPFMTFLGSKQFGYVVPSNKD